MTTRSWLRLFTFILPLTFLVFGAMRSADASGSRHPYFNDRGTLRWFHSLAEAKRVAQAEQKIIFIEYGRKACSNCRKIAQNVLPHSTVRPRMSRLCIGLAADCDRPERVVYDLFQANLRNARMLPFCAFITPRGRWITGWAGYASTSQMQRYLSQAEARHRSIFGASAARRPASTQARSPSRPTPSPAAPLPAPEVKPQDLGYTDAELEAEDTGADPCPDGNCEPGNIAPTECCPGGQCLPPGCENGQCLPPNFCEGGACAPPSFGERVIKGVKNIFGRGGTCCPPPQCPPQCPPTPTVEAPPAPPVHVERQAPPPTQDFPSPEPQVGEPQRRTADNGRAWPRAAPANGGAPRASSMPYGDPDAEAPATPAPRSPDLILAQAAAKRGDWGTVLILTREASIDQPDLRSLNRRAHAWAHGRLAYAVRAVREERYDDARKAMDLVSKTMKGEPEAVDARRGMQAIVLMKDLAALEADSPLRTTLRETNYEKMRGTRWAPLFSDVPTASPAISSR